MIRIVLTPSDGGDPYYVDWVEGEARGSYPCPIQSEEHADFLGLKEADINALSRAWGITRLEAAAYAYALDAADERVYVYDPGYWEAVATTSKRAETREPRHPKPDPVEARRTAMTEQIRVTPATKEALAEGFNVSTRLVADDLDAIGAVVMGKAGRKVLYGMPAEQSGVSQ